MHLIDKSVGHIGSSSIVGGGIPIGTGLALAIKMKSMDRVSVVFFGDGAVNEGALYESINFAILKRLPVVYVYENNQFSVCSRISSRLRGDVIFHGLSQDLMFTKKIDGNSVIDVYKTSKIAIEKTRDGKGPSFIECITYRMRGHAGSGSDAHLGYRTEEEIEEWEKRCPVNTFKDKLLKEKILSPEEIKKMETEIDKEIDEAFEFAQKSPLPKGEDIYLYLFDEKEE